jgi:hypothetical protein
MLIVLCRRVCLDDCPKLIVRGKAARLAPATLFLHASRSQVDPLDLQSGGYRLDISRVVRRVSRAVKPDWLLSVVGQESEIGE